MDDNDENTMMVDNENPKPMTSAASSSTGSKLAATSSGQSNLNSQLESVPLLDYITNIMKFIEAILSNNSTDDHCKEFVKQKGLVPLLQILSLPNLPIDFPNSTACQSVAQVCKAVLHLAREPQVIDQTFAALSETLANCESLYHSYQTNETKGVPSLVDGSVLIRELSRVENPSDAINWPAQTPLLHAISSVHSFIYLLITLGKINLNDVRNLAINKWGSELGVKILKNLCKLYMNLIWESSMLLWLCNEEQQQVQLQQLQQLYQMQLQQLSAVSDTAANTINTQLATLINQMSSSSGGFEFNKSDLEKLKSFMATNATQTPVAPLTSDTDASEKMETTAETKPPTQIVSYSKLLRPLFNCSSKLGRSLCELFGLLVKLSAGSSWKNTNARRNMMQQLHAGYNNPAPTQAAVNVSSALADISISGFSSHFALAETSTEHLHPKFRLTFYICSIGFTSSILFDEAKRPYHLMLQQFDQSKGLKALFDAFYWSLSLLNAEDQPDKDKLHEGTLEFIEAWLGLVQKLVHTKNMLETRHSLGNTSGSLYAGAAALTGDVKKACSFDPVKFLFKVNNL